MTIEIPDRTDFSDKFAALMAANVSLITSGIEPTRELSKQMIDEFLNQFVIATPAPATPYTAGFVVVANLTGHIPGEFVNCLYQTEPEALAAISSWITNTGHGRASSYGVRRVTYFV